MIPGDTIAAFATAVAPAGRIVIRTSGPTALVVLRQLQSAACGFAGQQSRACEAASGEMRLDQPDAVPARSSAERVTLAFAGLSCPAWVYAFHAPRSYTGEDVVEYGLPGSPVLARMLYDELLARGMRPAEPGEFTARAYFAGKLDLTEAEGVAATIAAASDAELAAARQLLSGELARRLRPITDALADTLALVEIGIDFAEEDVTFLGVTEVRRRVSEADEALRALLAEGGRSEPSVAEPRVVLAGRPNAGKSSLLNALAGAARAVVSSVAGTTRDVLSAPVDLPRGRVQLVDAAGVQDTSISPPVCGASTGLVETPAERGANGWVNQSIDVQMQSRAAAAIATADVLVLVRDATDDRPDVPLPRPADLRVVNKVDLRPGDIGVSALTGAGLDELRSAIDAAAFDRGGTAGRLALNARHRSALAEALSALARATDHAAVAELAAADLRAALDAVGSIVGSVTPDDVLGRIFGAFCIGK